MPAVCRICRLSTTQFETLADSAGGGGFGFRFSPFRFPGLGPTQGSWPVRVSCVETLTQFAVYDA